MGKISISGGVREGREFFVFLDDVAPEIEHGSDGFNGSSRIAETPAHSGADLPNP